MLAMWIVSRLIERCHPAADDPMDARRRRVDEMAEQLERSHRQVTKSARRRETKTIAAALRARFGVSIDPTVPNVRRIAGRLDHVDGQWMTKLYDDRGGVVASYRTEITDAGVLLRDPSTGVPIRDRAELASNLRGRAQSAAPQGLVSCPAKSLRRDPMAAV